MTRPLQPFSLNGFTLWPCSRHLNFRRGGIFLRKIPLLLASPPLPLLRRFPVLIGRLGGESPQTPDIKDRGRSRLSGFMPCLPGCRGGERLTRSANGLASDEWSQLFDDWIRKMAGYGGYLMIFITPEKTVCTKPSKIRVLL